MYFDVVLPCCVSCFIMFSVHCSVPGAAKEVSELERLFV